VRSDGRLIAVRWPHSASLASAARMNPSMVREGEDSATALRADRHARAHAGQRLADHAAQEAGAAPLGSPGRTAHRDRPHAAAAR
jgi:hypothetical protein